LSELGKIQSAFQDSINIRVLTGMTKEQAVADLRLLLESLVADAIAEAGDPVTEPGEHFELTRRTAQLALFTSWCRSEGL